MMDFYNKTGKMALGSRLRQLSDLITQDAAQIYKMYHIDLQPRWFPVFYILSTEGDKTISEIAIEIGHTHVSVSQIVKEMIRRGIAVEKRDRKDARKTIVGLSKSGKKISEQIKNQYLDVNESIENMLKQTSYNLWEAIGEWEHLLNEKSLVRRVREHQKARESKAIEIADYSPKYKQAFKSLNEEWISTYFKMEKADYKSLDHPKENIINKGGHIYIALSEGEPVGACALIKMDNDTYELAKMAVSPKAQGKGIGLLLGNAVINKARSLGAKKIYLESNTILKPAINLYYKLGFQKISGMPSPYQRCNIQMELPLK